MDVTQVPEFFVMLHNTELPEQRALQRSFLLNLLRDGIKSRQDYLVCARRRVFRILLSLQPSNLLTDKSEKVTLTYFILKYPPDFMFICLLYSGLYWRWFNRLFKTRSLPTI